MILGVKTAMTSAYPPTESNWALLAKILDTGVIPTFHFGKGFKVGENEERLTIVYKNFPDFCENVKGVYFAVSDAGNSDNRTRPFRDSLPFDSSDYVVDRMMFSTKNGYIVYVEFWSYYYDNDECGRTSIDVYATCEKRPQEILSLSKHAHIGLTAT